MEFDEYLTEAILCQYFVLTLTRVGIHPGQVEPTSPPELTTSRIEALQAGRELTRYPRPVLSPSCAA